MFFYIIYNTPYTNNGDLMKNTILNITISVLIVLLLILSYYYYDNEQKRETFINNKKLLTSINKHYNKYVITSKNSNLYKKINGKYKVIGSINKNKKLILDDIKIKLNTKYLKINNSNYYIYYKNVEETSYFEKDNRYSNYIYFNERIKTKDKFSLYGSNNQKIYNFKEPMEFQILIKDDLRYGVVYNDEVYYILKEDIDTIFNNNIQVVEKAVEIPVTVYHFLYLENEVCNEIICNSINQIKEEFNYLKQNNYFTINTKEVEYFINGKINLPKNSILITIDDGAQATKFLPILEEYKINATLFLISSWYKTSDFKSNYLEIASHTHNLHTPGVCSGGQGSPLKCMDKDYLLNDLKLSRETLNNTDAFCFPFYEYNDYAISVVRDAGFKTAYIGGDRKASIGINNYTIPRITIHNNISLDSYINLIK